MTDLRLDLYGDLPFLNEANKLLESQNIIKSLKVQALSNSILQQQNRSIAIIKHSKNIDFQIKSQQSFLLDKEKALLAECDRDSLKEIENTQLIKQTQAAKNSQDSINEKVIWHQQEIQRVEELIKQHRKQVKISQTEYEAIMVELREKEKDFLLLDKYTKIDDKLIHDTSLAIKKMQNEEYLVNKCIKDSKTELTTCTFDLKCTLLAFEQLNTAKNICLDNWESSLLQLQQIDERINLKFEELNKSVENEVELSQEIKNKEIEFSGEVREKNKSDYDIGCIERLISTKSIDIKTKLDKCEKIKSDLTHFEKELELLTQENSSAAAKVQFSNAELVASQQVICSLEYQISEITESMNFIRTPSALTELDTLIIKEHVKIDQMQRCIAKQQEKFGKLTLEFECKMEYKQAISDEIRGHEVEIKNVDRNFLSLETQLSDQDDILYNQEYKKLMLTNKLDVLKGRMKLEVKDKLKVKLSEMAELLQKHKNENKMLLEMLLKKKAVYKKSSLKNQKDLEYIDLNKEEYKSKLLICKRSTNVFSDSVASNDELSVRISLIELEISRTKQFLSHKKDNLVDLESKNVDYIISLQEKQAETQQVADNLKFKINGALDIKSKVLVEYNDRKRLLEILKSKYMIILQKGGQLMMGESEILIDLASKRQALNDKQELLKNQIFAASKDVEAMKATVLIMGSRQIAFQENIIMSNVTENDKIKKQTLCSTLDAAKQKLEQLNIELDSKTTELEQLESRIVNLEQAICESEQVIITLNKETLHLDNELALQMERIKRAANLADKVLKSIKTKRKVNQELVEEEDIYLRLQILRYKRLIDRVSANVGENKLLSEVFNELKIVVRSVSLKPFDTSSKSESSLYPKLVKNNAVKSFIKTLELTLK
eukprot:NODE_319_length_11107_cov_0.311228.p1 type:complete len:890 gc:universal NODE_319_length_11107_cov_0.311228:9083-6414(-)